MALGNEPAILLLRGEPALTAAPDVTEAAVRVVAGLHAEGGSLDAIVLVGDLTTTASGNEFEALTELIDRILDECFEAPGLQELPVVLAAPGSLDRQARSSSLVTVRSLTDWWPQVQGSFWANETPDLEEAIRDSYARLNGWYARYRPESGWQAGMLPGEGAVVLDAGGVRLGLAVANTTFRMLSVDAGAELATLHPQQVAMLLGDSEQRPSLDALALVAALPPTDPPPALPVPVFPIAGRPESAAGGGWNIAQSGASLLIAGRGGDGTVRLTDQRGHCLDAVAPVAGESAGPREAARSEGEPSSAAHEGEKSPRVVAEERAALFEDLDQAVATGNAILVVTSGIEPESCGEWGTELGSPDDLFEALAESLPAQTDGRVALAEVMSRLRQTDSTLVRRTVAGMLVDTGPAVNKTAMRLLLAPWYRIYDCTGTNIFAAIAARVQLDANVVVVDAHRDAPGSVRPQLEVVAMNGIAPGTSTAPVVFDIDDRGRGSRARWFRQMKADLITHPVVFVSREIGSRHLSLYLNALVGDHGPTKGQPSRFAIAPGDDPVVSWKLAGAGITQLPTGVAELARDRLGTSREPIRRGIQLRARARAVQDRNAGVQMVSALLEAAPDGDPLYLRGTDPTWGDVKEAIPASLSTLAAMLDAADAPASQRPVLVLNDRSGTGKSTTLMQLAMALYMKGLAVGWVDRATTKSSQDVFEECIDLGLDAVMIDDVDIFGAEAARLMTRLGRRGNVLVAATIRSTRGHLLDEVPGLTKVPPLRLTDEDLDALVHRLDTYRQLGKLKQVKLHAARVERLRRVCDRDLMAAMVEVITGYRFEQRVNSEFSQLDQRERNIYATVCLFEALQYEDRSLTLPQNALLQIASDGLPDLAVNRAIEGLISSRRMLVRRESGHIRTRHRVVAEAMEKSIRADKSYFRQLFEQLLLFYVQRGAGITDRNDPTRRAMVALINHRVMIKSGLSVKAVREVYNELHDYLKDDFHYWLQCGSYELEKRNLDLAATYLDTARGCEGGLDHFKVVTTWGMVCLRRANERPADGTLHAEAVDAFRELERVASQEGDRSPHTFTTIVQDGTLWLQRGAFFTMDERQGIARRILHWIGVGRRLLELNAQFRSVADHCAPALKKMVEAEEDRSIPL
ncbi:P-loop NTPase [Micromonospora radicis]|uniref:Novel STAND NTPase 5 domain-containing protein n=1 Tax=Micromonospora radicis TaxID=1894971 RepID=A0A418MU71_9ACTN|nr:hypothetical protein [Micromonospora radicis]RIV37739.1 hypothetical protein D2L64_14250 [Micromonospora radicis]